MSDVILLPKDPRLILMGFYSLALGLSASGAATGFDSELVASTDPAENHILRIDLKLFLKQVHGRTVINDADGNPFPIKDWLIGDWFNFKVAFKRQALKWDRKFWLMAPGDFSSLDISLGSAKMRPNVKCRLNVILLNSASGAHRTIEVANVDQTALAAQLGQSSAFSADTFRSSVGTIDSLDMEPLDFPMHDETGNARQYRHYMITHEIGHALGLDHIGVLRQRPNCTMAMVVEADPFFSQNLSSFPALYHGGSDSPACYGDFEISSIGANVMGAGSTFDAINAKPWIDRIALHTNTEASRWTATTIKVPPFVVLGA